VRRHAGQSKVEACGPTLSGFLVTAFICFARGTREMMIDSHRAERQKQFAIETVSRLSPIEQV
jgi:hypothetical protein